MQGILDDLLRSIGLSAAEIAAFKELMNAAIAHRRAQWEKMEPEDQKYWALEYAELAHEVGIPRLYDGMRKAWTWNKHLICAAEAREYIPSEPDPKPRATWDPRCADCDGTGWRDAGAGRVRRCDCNVRPHRTKVAEAADPQDPAWIEKLAELNAKLGMPAFAAAKRPAMPAMPPPSIIPTSAELARELTGSGWETAQDPFGRGILVWGKRTSPQEPPEQRGLSADQLQQRKGVERVECQCVEDHLKAQLEGRYEKKRA
jgi:hypothetical protein